MNEQLEKLTTEFAEFQKKHKTLETEFENIKKENIRLAQENTELANKHAAAEFTAFLDGLIKTGKVYPAEKDALIEEFSDLRTAQQAMTFKEGEKDLTAKLKERLEARTPIVDIRSGHFAVRNNAAAGFEGIPAKFAGLKNIDGKSVDIDRRANEYLEKHDDVTSV